MDQHPTHHTPPLHTQYAVCVTHTASNERFYASCLCDDMMWDPDNDTYIPVASVLATTTDPNQAQWYDSPDDIAAMIRCPESYSQIGIVQRSVSDITVVPHATPQLIPHN